MLRPAPRPRRWRTLAGVLAALLAAPALAVGSASAAQADAVRQQELWVLNAIDVASAWQHTHGSGVTVALIDSGVNGQVSDLSGSVTTGRDFSGVNTPPTDANWGVHGTWMASLIAGHGHAGGSSGITGVAPAAKILSIRAVTDQGDPGYRHYQHESESRVQGHLANAIRYATSKRVSVISMSLGYQGASRQVRAAISDALAQGIVVVASSGNSGGASSGTHGNAPYSFPADYPGVLGVGAVAQNGLPAGFSSDNLSVQVAAPGVRVPAQGRDGQYWLVSGTSPACALTAGVAALIKSVYPALAPALVVQAITSSTSNKPQGRYDEEVGFGTVDATAALKMAGRLARDRGTGRGLVAAAQFGGGTAAIPPVPVAPRTNRQFLADSLIALACLAVVLIVAFRLIVTRRPAAAGVPGVWAGPPDSRASAGRAGTAPTDPGPPDLSSQEPGLPDPAASSASGAWSDDSGTGYGRSAGYWAPGGYKPSAGYPSPPGYGSSDGLLPPDDPGPPTGSGSAGGHEWPASPGSAGGDVWSAGYGQLMGFGASEGYQPWAGTGSQADSPPPAGYLPPPASAGPPASDGPAAGNGLAAGYRLPARPAPPAAGIPGAFESSASGSPDAKTGPLAEFAAPAEPQDLSSHAGDPPAADDDTWPASGQW
jgi:hypothetical protein